MANKYISWDTGNDSTGDGSLGTPWKTFTKALGATGIGDGDVLYAAPGIYRETVSVAMTSPTGETKVLGDPWNAQGFSGVSPGPVILTPFTTDDESASANVSTLTLSQKDYLTFENLYICIGQYATSTYALYVSQSENVTFRSCIIFGTAQSSLSGAYALYLTPAADTPANLTIDSCLFYGGYLRIAFPGATAADIDHNITIRNTVVDGANAYGLNVTSSTGTFKDGGIDIIGCYICGYYAVFANDNDLSTTYPITITDSIIRTASTALYASTSGIIVEDYNLILSFSARNNVSAGSNSEAIGTTVGRAHYAGAMMREMWGIYPHFGYHSPLPFSGTMNFAATTGLSVDMLNRPKPSGGGPIYSTASGCIGALECHEYGVQDTSTKDAGDASIKLTGPGDHELVIPVAAESTTISIKARYASASYGGTNYPQAILIDRESFANITSDTETKTATVSASDAWETLTFTAFTPSRKGVVRLRLVNRSSAGAGVCWFDTVTVT